MKSATIKTILYATDFSDSSQVALKHALMLGERTGAKMIFIHVADIPIVMNSPIEPPDFEELLEDVKTNARARLLDFCEHQINQSGCKKVKFDIKVEQVPAIGILEAAAENAADLIVMGTKGSNRIRRLLLGSSAKSVLENSKCPVFIVPKNAPTTPIRNIVYATDFEQEDIEAVKRLSAIATVYDAEIIVLHIKTDREYAGKQKMEWFKELLLERVDYANIRFELLLSDDIFGELNNYVRNEKIDLVGMLEREKLSLYDRWFHRDLVKRMEFHAAVPLISFSEKHLKLSFGFKSGVASRFKKRGRWA